MPSSKALPRQRVPRRGVSVYVYHLPPELGGFTYGRRINPIYRAEHFCLDLLLPVTRLHRLARSRHMARPRTAQARPAIQALPMEMPSSCSSESMSKPMFCSLGSVRLRWLADSW